MKQDMTIKKMKLEDNSVFLKKFIKGIEGGRTLDVTDYTEEVIPCGYVIASKTTKGVKTYFPLPTAKDAETGKTDYRALTSGEAYEGLLVSSILKEKPAAAIMTWGIVNSEVLPYAIPDEFKKALPHIDYQKDEEA
ncbi:MAG: hypothetical protein KBT34_05460 [Prevotella sp.]|nr:hypothetical protein [Candidatus Prevotella equi]